jgi:hypothetical protein
VNNGAATTYALDKADNRTAVTTTGAGTGTAGQGTLVVVPLDGLTPIIINPTS